MYMLKTIAAGALAIAQLAAAQATLAFTNVPSQVVAGQPVTIQYGAQDLSQPATITLRKGNPANLGTIAVLTSEAVNGSYVWIPTDSLADASDYALQISQGSEVNYSSQFSLTGANASAVSSALAATSSAISMQSSLTASVVSSIQSVIASYNSSLGNLTAPVILPTSPPTNVTIPASASASASAGTGTSLIRNTTMVSPTLSASPSRSVAATTTTRIQGGESGRASSTTPTGASSTGAAASLAQVSTSVSALLVVAAMFFYQ